MNPTMLWDAEMIDALVASREAGLINVEKKSFQLPVDDPALLAELPDGMQDLYIYANGVEIRWRSAKDSAQGGRINFLPIEDVLRDGLGSVYEKDDLKEDERLEFFKPFDLVTDEAQCGFLHKAGIESRSIYYNRSGRPQLHDLDLDVQGYLAMALAARGYFHWPIVLLDLQTGAKSPETLAFEQAMPALFADFDQQAFEEEYRSLRLSLQ